MSLPVSQLHEGIIVNDEFHTVQVQGLPMLFMNSGILKSNSVALSQFPHL